MTDIGLIRTYIIMWGNKLPGKLFQNLQLPPNSLKLYILRCYHIWGLDTRPASLAGGSSIYTP